MKKIIAFTIGIILLIAGVAGIAVEFPTTFISGSSPYSLQLSNASSDAHTGRVWYPGNEYFSESRSKANIGSSSRDILNFFEIQEDKIPQPRSDSNSVSPRISDEATSILKNIPLYFIPNIGQTDPSVLFLCKGRDFSIFFTKNQVIYSLPFDNNETTRRNTVIQRFLDSNPDPIVEGSDPAITRVSYFIGPESEWHSNITPSREIKYRQIYQGIDLVYRALNGTLKREFHVRPGADPNSIHMIYDGADDISVAEDGSLVIAAGSGEVKESPPICYQIREGVRIFVPCRFKISDNRSITFSVGRYDPSLPLIIDPTLTYCGYIGGSNRDYAYGIAVDNLGNAYVSGETMSDELTFPVMVGQDLTFNGYSDAFVAKVSSSGTGLIYCSYIGGYGADQASAIKVDSLGNAYITGMTMSDESSFPVTVGPDLTLNGNSDAFIAKINPSGTSLTYCGYIGGLNLEYGESIAVDSAGNSYITGVTTSNESTFPVTIGPGLIYHGNGDAFVAKVKSDGTGLIYSGFIGGSDWDDGHGIAIDSAGNAYIAGRTASDESTFPVAVGPDLTYNGGSWDVFTAKVNPSGTMLTYCGYIGGLNYEFGQGIVADDAGNSYITGITYSDELTFPVTIGPDLTYNQNGDAFITRVDPTGTGLTYCGYIGGGSLDEGTGIALDSSGNTYITGLTQSSDSGFPLMVGPKLTFGGEIDAFVTKVNSAGTELIYSGFIGGSGSDYGIDIAVDNFGNAYIMGMTKSDQSTFPVTIGPDLTYNGDSDTFVAKVPPLKTTIAPLADFTAIPLSGTAPLTVQFNDESIRTPTGWAWFFGDENYTASWTQQTLAAEWSGRALFGSVAMPDGSIVILGGSSCNPLCSQKNDVWRSTDYGITWMEMTPAAPWSGRYHFSSVAMPDGSIVLMGGGDGSGGRKNDVWRSADNGATWSEMTPNAGWSEREGHSCVALSDGSIVLFGGYTGVYKNDVWRSMDNGVSWTEITPGAEWPARTLFNRGNAMPDGSIVLTGGFNDDNLNDVWRSTDNGATWTQQTAIAEWSGKHSPVSVAMPDGSIVLMGGYDPLNASYVNDVWRSKDNGVTWTQVISNAEWSGRSDQGSVAMPDGSIVLMGGHDNGGFIKNDTWRFIPIGSSTQNPSHTFPAPGIYQVALQAYNADGYHSIRKTGYITVTVPPVADFIGFPTTGAAPLIVQFNDTSTGFDLNTWNWSFGDTTWFNTSTSSQRNTSHTYTNSGFYTVALAVSNVSGSNTSTKIGYITVSIPPTTVQTTSTTIPTTIPTESNSDDSIPISTNLTAVETTVIPSITNTVNVGGSSAINRVIVAGTGIFGIIVTGTVKFLSDNDPIPPGIVYQYIELYPAQYKTITGAEIFFSVPVSWLDKHKIPPKNVILHHLVDNNWVGQPTKVLKMKDGYVFYSAKSPGFSLFAIAGVPGNLTGVPTQIDTAMPANTILTTLPIEAPAELSPAATQTSGAPSTSVFPVTNILILCGAGSCVIVASYLIRRWWIRRKNPMLFQRY